MKINIKTLTQIILDALQQTGKGLDNAKTIITMVLQVLTLVQMRKELDIELPEGMRSIEARMIADQVCQALDAQQA